MRVLIIGGNGFIGSHLALALRARSHMVRVLNHGPPRIDVDWNGVEYRVGEYADPKVLAPALNDVDVVCHLASSTVPATANKDPVADIEQNLVSSVTLCEQMMRAGVRRIVFFSSGGTVYGDPEMIPVDENHPLRPISSYGVVKVAIENYLLMYAHLDRLEPLILRPSNPFGPRQALAGAQGVIGRFLGACLGNEVVPLVGDGSVVRDFIYIDDLIELTVRGIESGATGVYNAGSGIGHSLRDVVAIIQRVTDGRLRWVPAPARPFDVQKIVLDVSAVTARLQWRPLVGIEQGIAATWQSLVLTDQ
ncbi:MAG: NAD-dependent epimerase [Gammaproteobacteria bacterium HGW-Gammaproteobacteria-6]|nr:MAG: NAD-dependent epimerase [Gammaproteobacteria bacterium HGW-Gammaproteobacteria-6]